MKNVASTDGAKEELGATWYRLTHYSREIEERTVTKSTSQTVWYRHLDWDGKPTGQIRQERKGGDWFPTKREALDEARKRLEKEEMRARDTYSQAVERLKKFNEKHAGELG